MGWVWIGSDRDRSIQMYRRIQVIFACDAAMLTETLKRAQKTMAALAASLQMASRFEASTERLRLQAGATDWHPKSD